MYSNYTLSGVAFKVFSVFFWLAIIASLIIFSNTVFFLSKVNKKAFRLSYQESIWRSFSLFLNHNEKSDWIKTMSQKITFIFLSFLAVLLLSLFQNLLLTQLLLPHKSRAFTNLDALITLIKNKEYSLVPTSNATAFNKVKMKNRICSLGNNVANYAHFFGNSPFFGTFSRNKDQMRGIFQNLPLKLEL